METGLLVTLGLIALYVVFIVWLVQTGRLAKWNLSLMLGIVLMVRTQRGRDTIEVLARPKRFWNAFGDFSTVFVLVGMAAMTALFAFSVWFTLQPDSGVEPLGASEILVIPGVNPFVPLWYGIVALIITLVVHEGGHGILARANAMRIKSIGLLFAVVPVGAFVEPDEEDLKTATRRKRLRVFSAGPSINIGLALILLAAFAGMVGGASFTPGVHVGAAVKDSPADDAGLEAGNTIVSADDRPLADWDAFVDSMEGRSPGDTVLLGMRDGRQLAVVLESRWENLSPSDQERITRQNATRADELRSDAFLGVAPVTEDTIAFLSHPFGSRVSFLQLVSLPIGEVKGQPFLSTYMPSAHDAPGNEDLYWIGARLLFWMFWINLMVGLTNILPMIPLDGGHIFRDAVGGAIEKANPRADPRRVDRAVAWTSGFVSLFILAAFILQIVGPRLVQ